MKVKLASATEERRYLRKYPWIKSENLIRLMWTKLHRIAVIDAGKYMHIRINRLNRKPIRSWQELQDAKNAAVGKEVFAMQVYPKESRLINNAHTYHLFVPKDQSAVPDLTAMYNY